MLVKLQFLSGDNFSCYVFMGGDATMCHSRYIIHCGRIVVIVRILGFVTEIQMLVLMMLI